MTKSESIKKLCVVQVILQVNHLGKLELNTYKNELLCRVDKSENSYTVKGKATSLQAWAGPKGSRRLRLPDFKTIGT